MKIGVDVGFGYVKAMNDAGKKVMFPTVISPRGNNLLKGVISIGAEEDYLISYKDNTSHADFKNFYVGDSAMTNGGSRKWENKDSFNVDELKLLISTAVGVLNDTDEPVHLSVGLPLSHYIQKKDELRNILKEVKAEIKINNSKHTKQIKFHGIFIFPQGAGAYYSAVLDEHGNVINPDLANASVGLIDVGYRTVDYLVMTKGKNGITMAETLSGSLEEDGMNKAFTVIDSTVSDELGSEIGVMEIEKAVLWFNSKLDHYSEVIDLMPYEHSAYLEHADKIASQIKLKWGKQEERMSHILITGGGGSVLFPHFKTKFKQAELQDDCSYANCRGYLAVQAMKIKAKKAKEEQELNRG